MFTARSQLHQREAQDTGERFWKTISRRTQSASKGRRRLAAKAEFGLCPDIICGGDSHLEQKHGKYDEFTACLACIQAKHATNTSYLPRFFSRQDFQPRLRPGQGPTSVFAISVFAILRRPNDVTTEAPHNLPNWSTYVPMLLFFCTWGVLDKENIARL